MIGGPLLREPSPLARALPAGAWFTMLQSWKKDAVTPPAEEIAAFDLPPALASFASDLLGRFHTLIEPLQSEVAFALYIDRKGRWTLVFLATTDDEAATKTTLRELFAAAASGGSQLGPDLRITQEKDVLHIELPSELDDMPVLFGLDPREQPRRRPGVHEADRHDPQAPAQARDLGPGQRRRSVRRDALAPRSVRAQEPRVHRRRRGQAATRVRRRAALRRGHARDTDRP